MTVGAMTDLHGEPDPPCTRGWINSYEPAQLDRRIAEALDHLRAREVR
jgi:hypothetical protein